MAEIIINKLILVKVKSIDLEVFSINSIS